LKTTSQSDAGKRLRKAELRNSDTFNYLYTLFRVFPPILQWRLLLLGFNARNCGIHAL